MSAEEWRPVPGWPGYEVSNQGRIVSYKRGSRRVMRSNIGSAGYRKLSLRRDGKAHTLSVHALVLEAFSGPAPAGYEARHLDGNRLNNNIENLRWGTRSENMQDKIAHGTHYPANRTHCAKGHEYTAANTRIDIDTQGRKSRRCRACRAIVLDRLRKRRMGSTAPAWMTEAAS